MTDYDLLVQAIIQDPADELVWLALADWHEESNEPQRAELLRLTRTLRQVKWRSPKRRGLEDRVIELLKAGVEPANPVWVNSVGMRFRLIPAGDVLMGPKGRERQPDERGHPQREVTLTQAFWMGETLLTQEQYARVMRTNPSSFSHQGGRANFVKGLKTETFPVERVSWDDCIAFCQELEQLPAEKGRQYRLPTEAQWEYACRAGRTATQEFYFGSTCTSHDCNVDGNQPYQTGILGPSMSRPSAVKSYLPNAFGLHDMHGNVWEWCRDTYSSNAYRDTSPVDPVVEEEEQTQRVIRGGSWLQGPERARSARRMAYHHSQGFDNLGVRLVMLLAPVRSGS